MKVCVFAGTFDPITKGHESIIKTALKDYDVVKVVIGVNAKKTPLFSIEKRLEFITKTFGGDKRVSAEFYQGYLVDYLKENQITDYIRGIRDNNDIEYEKIMESFNKARYPEINTIYIPCEERYKEVSSTLVRKLIKGGKDFSKFVPQVIIEDIKELFK